MKRFDLRGLRFDESGEAWRRLSVEVAPFVFGGLAYEINGGAVDLLVSAGRVGDSMTLVAEFEGELQGPCQRCLGVAVVGLAARAVEYVQHGNSEVDEEGGEPGYVAANIVDLETWVRDLVAEALPEKLICSDACRGLCPVCGADLNADPDHRHESP